MAVLHYIPVLLVCVASVSAKNPFQVPEQIHISYGENPTQMIVTWSTMNATQSSTVKYGPSKDSLSQVAQGTSVRFEDFGELHHTQYIHKTVLTGLKPGKQYVYQCGSAEAWSLAFFNFTAMKDGQDWSPRIALYGDFGFINPQSLGRLLMDKKQNMYDAIFHVGDFAYDMVSDNGTMGDRFLNKIQPLASELPYMTCPGNHEAAYNFTHYRHRFAMPGDMIGDHMYYSFDMGPMHVISLSTEYYFQWEWGFLQPYHQFNWLKEDLIKANANRKKVPWIMVMGHRPMYCSNNDGDDCTKKESVVRTGIPVIHMLGMEELFYEQGVDLMIWAHEHSYERLWPVYNEKVCNGSYSAPYTNPQAPVHIITGSAGCQERHDKFLNHTADWSAFRSDDYGYTRMTVKNATHIQIDQVSDDLGGKVIDSITLIKEKHGKFGQCGQPEKKKPLDTRLKFQPHVRRN